MEWLEGEDLSSFLARQGLTIAEAVRLMLHVAEALAHPDSWPFRTAVLTGPPRSGKSLFARWFAESGKGDAIDDAQALEPGGTRRRQREGVGRAQRTQEGQHGRDRRHLAERGDGQQRDQQREAQALPAIEQPGGVL